MDRLWQGRLVGTFLGFGYGRIYQLDDGSRWQQDSRTDEPSYRDDPEARLLFNRDTGSVFLEVVGTSSVARVLRCGSRPTPRSGAI